MAGKRDIYTLRPWPADLRHLCEHMRDADWREIACLYQPGLTRRELADMIYRALDSYVFARVISLSPLLPAAAFVGVQVPAGAAIGGAHMFATRKFGEVARGLTAFITDELAPHMVKLGLTRVEVRAWAENHAALAWLRRLGAVEEVRLPGFGRDGEEFVQFAWRRDDVLRGTDTAAAA